MASGYPKGSAERAFLSSKNILLKSGALCNSTENEVRALEGHAFKFFLSFIG